MSNIPIAHPRRDTLLVLLTLLIVATLFSCGEAGREPESTAPTKQVTLPLATPTPTPSQRTKTIYTLVDRSASYKRFTNQALSRLSELLPHVLRPGDQLRVAWIDSQSGDPERTFVRDEVGRVECPASPPEPAPPATLESGTTMERQREHKEREEYARQQQEWKVQDERLKNECIDIQQTAVQEFLERNAPRIKDNALFFDDAGTRIYEAVYEASSYFASFNTPGRPVKRKLLIFSDMQESRSGLRDEVPIDLSGVDVIVAMFYFEELGARENSKGEWTRIFKNGGAESVEFLVIDASTVEKITDLMLR